MILEHAILPVIAGREAEFERAFAQARSIIASMPGFGSLRLARSHESPSEYLLHEFYEPFPRVEHFLAVSEVPAVAGSAIRS